MTQRYSPQTDGAQFIIQPCHQIVLALIWYNAQHLVCTFI